MKKFFAFIRLKGRNEKTQPSADKKISGNEKEKNLKPATTDQRHLPELFWDGYSDIGYC